MAGKTTLTIRIPDELKQRIETLSAQQGISINQFALYAFAKQIGELEAGTSFRDMTRGLKRKEILARVDELLARVPDRDVPEWDSMEVAEPEE